MVRLELLGGVIVFVLMVYCLIDVIQTPEGSTRNQEFLRQVRERAEEQRRRYQAEQRRRQAEGETTDPA